MVVSVIGVSKDSSVIVIGHRKVIAIRGVTKQINEMIF